MNIMIYSEFEFIKRLLEVKKELKSKGLDLIDFNNTTITYRNNKDLNPLAIPYNELDILIDSSLLDRLEKETSFTYNIKKKVLFSEVI